MHRLSTINMELQLLVCSLGLLHSVVKGKCMKHHGVNCHHLSQYMARVHLLSRALGPMCILVQEVQATPTTCLPASAHIRRPVRLCLPEPTHTKTTFSVDGVWEYVHPCTCLCNSASKLSFYIWETEAQQEVGTGLEHSMWGKSSFLGQYSTLPIMFSLEMKAPEILGNLCQPLPIQAIFLCISTGT